MYVPNNKYLCMYPIFAHMFIEFHTTDWFTHKNLSIYNPAIGTCSLSKPMSLALLWKLSEKNVFLKGVQYTHTGRYTLHSIHSIIARLTPFRHHLVKWQFHKKFSIFILWIQPTWAPDKQVKMVLLKSSFSRKICDSALTTEW